ncbi:MAG: hypothetical protein KC635_23400 [Myxococcales bacterium]|nr:hypothetical protein [Myxococcales bacterium]
MTAPLPEPRERLLADLLAFVAAPDPGAFDALAARVVAYQARALPEYGRLAALAPPTGWRDAPLVPTDLFRDLDLCSLPGAAATFRTSGTTGVGRRGARRVPDLRLYDAAMRAPFVAHVLGGDPRPRPWLSLIPTARELPDSSLSHMVSGLAPELATTLTTAMSVEGGLDLDAALRALAGDAPLVLLTTGFALVALLDALPAAASAPPGSRLMLTGGFKGRSRELSEPEVLDLVAARLGVPPARVVPEYGMTELTSQAYGRPLAPNPGLRFRVVDPVTLDDLPAGADGLVACFDLLNLDNVSAILTGDLGRLDERGRLTLHGRAPDAVRRGCSLTAEEILERLR